MSEALGVRELTAGYGRTEVLHAASLAVGRGEIVALIGANGAGKSTLLNAVVGAVRIWSGSILLHGIEIAGQQPDAVVRRGLALVPPRPAALRGERGAGELR